MRIFVSVMYVSIPTLYLLYVWFSILLLLYWVETYALHIEILCY